MTASSLPWLERELNLSVACAGRKYRPMAGGGTRQWLNCLYPRLWIRRGQRLMKSKEKARKIN